MEPQRAPIVVVAGFKFVQGLDAFTGQRVWAHELPAAAATPRVCTAGDVAIVLAHTLYCIRIATGEMVWKSQPTTSDFFLVAHGVITIASYGKVTGLSVADGRMLWQTEIPKAQFSSFGMEGGPSVSIDKT